MTDPGDEQAQTGSGEFRDVVDVQLLDESLLVAARIARFPSAGSASVTALVIADTLEAQVGALGIDRDLLLAASLCHDVGKPFEFSHRNQARWRSDPSAVGHPSMRHTLYGVYITLTAGLPEAVAHVAGAHSPEGQFVTRSLLCTIIHQADYAFWDVLRSAGLLQQP